MSFIFFLILISVLSPLGIAAYLLLFNIAGANPRLMFWSAVQIFVLFSTAMIFYAKDNFKPWYALAFPLGAALFIGIPLKALFELAIKKELSWRGRIYK